MIPSRRASLVQARQACLALAGFVYSDAPAGVLGAQHRPLLAALLEEFSRLDQAEQRALTRARPSPRSQQAGS